MGTEYNILEKIKKGFGLDRYGIPILMVLMLLLIIVVVYYSQTISEQTSLPPIFNPSSNPSSSPSSSPSFKEQYEIAKLAAEIRQIRSDTSGSLFWLKMIALFVTVGGAVGGYLVGQKQTTKKRLEFENLKNIDSIYQGMVLELADKSNPLLRAAAAVKLGMILKSFPSEWAIDEERKRQMIQLTKQVLAASLAIEKDTKVLKTVTIAIVLHRRFEKKRCANVRGLDLSWAKANDAYWARVNFCDADFYRAQLAGASFRWSVLRGAQFRDADLRSAVFAKADCQGANFKAADLRNAKLPNAKLRRTNFEEAKVFGCELTGAKLGDNLADNPDAWVDDSEDGDGSHKIKLQEWLALHQGTKEQPVTS